MGRGGAGAKRLLVADEITFCNSTVRRRILIPAINLRGSPRTDLFDPGAGLSSLPAVNVALRAPLNATKSLPVIVRPCPPNLRPKKIQGC